MELIKDTVSSLLKKLQEKGGPDKPHPEDVLKNILTKRELGHIKVKYFKAGVLYLSVDSSGWLFNFNLKKQALRDSLKAKLPEIKEIRMSLGPVDNL
ncbi:MAG: DciA family protein [Candidatus Omnitrophica bacterium]|nr:DciA family protein [Candidatus Omnitrophota bacterium]